MSSANQVNGSQLVTGTIYAGGFSFLSGATSIIPATNLQFQRKETVSLALHGATPSAVRREIMRVNGTTATLQSFKVSLITALASGTLTVDLYKNGSSILTGTVGLNSTGGSGGTNYDIVAGTFSSTAAVAGDVFEVVGTVSTPSGGGGWACQLVYKEDAA